jgi:hypothetical protein
MRAGFLPPLPGFAKTQVVVLMPPVPLCTTYLEQISKRRSRPSSSLYVLLYTAGRRLNGYDVRKSALEDI